MHLRTSLVTIAAVAAASLVALSGAANAASVTATFASGNASFAGSTYGCTGGTVTGTSSGRAITFSSLSINCSTPLGTATASLNTGCTIVATFPTATAAIETSLAGSEVFGTGTCIKVSMGGGFCTANVQGTVSATYDETVGANTLTLNGPGTLANQSAGCFGLWTGTFTLNNIRFSLSPDVNLQ
jgi:hypothetical protein